VVWQNLMFKHMCAHEWNWNMLLVEQGSLLA